MTNLIQEPTNLLPAPPKGQSIKIWMGPNPNGPLSKLRSSYDRYSGFFGVRSFVGPTGGDFLESVSV